MMERNILHALAVVIVVAALAFLVAGSITEALVALAAAFIVEIVNFARNAKCGSSWMDCDMVRLNSDDSLFSSDRRKHRRGPLGPPPAVQP